MSGAPPPVDGGPRIDPGVRERYGDVNLVYLIVSDLVIVKTPPRLKKVARKAEAEFREAADGEWPGARLARWEAFGGEMGLEAVPDLPAPRALAESVRRGRNIPKINYVVDAANVTALEYETPVGAFDLDTLAPPIRLRLAAERESLVPILSSDAVECVPGEIVYADGDRIFSRYSRDADFSKITDETKRILCVVDGPPGTEPEYLVTAAESLAALLVEVGNPELTVSGPHLAGVEGAAAEA